MNNPEKSSAPTPAAGVHYQNDQPPPYTPGTSTSDPPLGFSAPYPMQPPPPLYQSPPISIITPTVVTPVSMIMPLGPNSARMTCPYCHSQISSHIKQSPSTLAYISALIICAIGCFCGCCLIPFCMDTCKTTEHTCPHCDRMLGRYTRN